MVRSLALCPDDTKQDSVVNSIIPGRNPLSPSHPVLSVLHPQGFRKRFASAAARRSFGGASPPTKVFSFATSSRCSHTRLSQKHGCTKSSDGPISCAVPQRYEARLGGEQYNTGEKPTVMLYTYLLHESPCRDTRQKQNKKQFSVCVCVCFLPIHYGRQVRWAYQPGSHRRKVTQDVSSTFLLRSACLNFSREKDSALSFLRRP